jgi:hypothetical protein
MLMEYPAVLLKHLSVQTMNCYLLLKLNVYGIRNRAGQWFKLYLHDRKQQVEINMPVSNKVYSDWGVIKHRVPEGSILGPLPSTINNQFKPPLLMIQIILIHVQKLTVFKIA